MTGVGRKLVLVFTFFLLLFSAEAQQQYYKFKIAKGGVYHLTDTQAKQVGASSISEISIFGYPGVLPQKLDSANLELQEIAAKEENGELFFYLSDPYNSSYDSKDEVHYIPNLFSDSLSFLVSKNQNPKRISTIKGIATNQNPSVLYQWNWLKEEENNILSSGRTWYSRSLAPGITRGYAFPLQNSINAPWKASGILMASSLTPASITLGTESQTITALQINPILNSTYAIKGREVSINLDFQPTGNKIERLRFSFSSTDPNASGYFNYLGIGVPYSSLDLFSGTYLIPQENLISISTKVGQKIWGLNDFFNPKEYDLTSGNGATVQKLVVFDPNQSVEIKTLTPTSQNLRSQGPWPELLIIAPALLKNSAEKLRMHKLSIGVFAEIGYLNEIYDSFGYGNPDLNAIRNFIAWHYQQGGKLKNVLILGKGTFDYKGRLGGRPNLVPIYTSRNSLNPLSTFSSDDYFGLLDWGNGVWEESRNGDEPMKIGVGRLPVINGSEASVVINKIIDYELNQKPGDWKKTITLLADDADNNIHLRDTEAHAATLLAQNPEFKLEKLYLDRFEQEKNGTIQSSPQAKKALEEQLDRGTLFLNYVGHGNETTLTAEEIFLVSDIQNWAKQNQLALWVTATCEFGRHDSPFLRSAAEELLIVPNKGAIGLLTTGRPVFSSVNFSLNEAFIETVFQEENGKFQDLGTIFKKTKNGSMNGSLNRNFSLLGDPSMRLARPEFEIKITAIKDLESDSQLDTLKAFQRVSFEAEVVTLDENRIATEFSGTYEIELHDKPQVVRTLGDESTPTEFKEESISLFRGSGSISSGQIKGELIIPKNTKPDFGFGNLRIIGKQKVDNTEAFGNFVSIIGGALTGQNNDQIGPEIKAIFGNSDQTQLIFSATVVPLVAEFKDESGVNSSNLNPLESMRIQVNNDEEQIISAFYLASNNTFKEGSAKVELKGLKEGKNTIRIKAWDTIGNGSELVQEILIEGSKSLKIVNHKTYPNPTSNESKFQTEHNRPGENIILSLIVYQADGKILFEENQRFTKADAVLQDLSWTFYQNQTKYPAKGTYIYKLTIQSELDYSSDSVSGKIVIQ
jgi:hypothetical protein